MFLVTVDGVRRSAATLCRLRAVDFGQSEVENLGMPALGDEDVRGLDVAMNDAFGVRGIQRVGNLDGQVESSVSISRAGRRCDASACHRPEIPSR